jgi:hypothetical protein
MPIYSSSLTCPEFIEEMSIAGIVPGAEALMPTYIFTTCIKAMRRAEYEKLEDGTGFYLTD